MKRLCNLIVCLMIMMTVNMLSAHAENVSWQGKLGDNINVRIDLEMNEMGYVGGQTTYFRKNGKKSIIPLAGYRKYNEGNWDLFLTEHVGTKYCGYYMMTIDQELNLMDGVWSFGDTQHEMNNMQKLPNEKTQTFLTPVKYGEGDGVYSFTVKSNNPTMPEYGGTAEICFEHKYVSYHFCQVTPNIAETYGSESEVYENTYYFQVGDYYYHAGIYKDCVIVRREGMNPGSPDSFGANADIAGIYFKTKDALSEEVKHAFDDEKSFGKSLPTTVFLLNDAWNEQIGGFTTYPDELITIDLDNDGQLEILAHYTADRTPLYDVPQDLWAVFCCRNGAPVLLAVATDEISEMSIGGEWVVVRNTVANASGIRATYFRVKGSRLEKLAVITDEGEYKIDNRLVTKQEFEKTVNTKHFVPIRQMDGWREIPGNVHRNETAARG